METKVKERPIKFLPKFVPKIIDGAKTNSRRLMDPQPTPFDGQIHPSNIRRPDLKAASYIDSYRNAAVTEYNPGGKSENWCWWTPDDRQGSMCWECPWGKPGDVCWVQEPFYCDDYRYPDAPAKELLKLLEYSAEHNCCDWEAGCPCDDESWLSAGSMPRWASRHQFTLTDVRVERIQDITDEGIEAEGYPTREEFIESWSSIYPGSWERNDWVWVLCW